MDTNIILRFSLLPENKKFKYIVVFFLCVCVFLFARLKNDWLMCSAFRRKMLFLVILKQLFYSPNEIKGKTCSIRVCSCAYLYIQVTNHVRLFIWVQGRTWIKMHLGSDTTRWHHVAFRHALDYDLHIKACQLPLWRLLHCLVGFYNQLIRKYCAYDSQWNH